MGVSRVVKRLPESQAIALLRTAAELNPRWYEPPYLQSKFAKTPREKEALVAQALKLNPRRPEIWQELAEVQSANGQAMSAQNSWARAEDNAASDEQRDRIRRARDAAESKRLNAEEAARREAQEAARAEDARLRQAQMDRIHAAERRANASNGASGGPKGAERGSAVVERVEPAAGWAAGAGGLPREQLKLFIKPANGKTKELLVKDPSAVNGNNAPLTCGVQRPAKHLSVTYRPRVDAQLGTAGDVDSIHFE